MTKATNQIITNKNIPAHPFASCGIADCFALTIDTPIIVTKIVVASIRDIIIVSTPYNLPYYIPSTCVFCVLPVLPVYLHVI